VDEQSAQIAGMMTRNFQSVSSVPIPTDVKSVELRRNGSFTKELSRKLVLSVGSLSVVVAGITIRISVSDVLRKFRTLGIHEGQYGVLINPIFAYQL